MQKNERIGHKHLYMSFFFCNFAPKIDVYKYAQIQA